MSWGKVNPRILKALSLSVMERNSPLLKICPMMILTQQQAWMILVASEVYPHLDLLLMQLSSCELGELLQQSP
jgi:hypothetical protein